MNYVKRLVSVIVLGSVVSSSLVSAYADNMGTIKKNDAIIKSDASDEAENIKTLDLGQTVEVLDMEGDYYRVAIEGIEKAFVLSDFVNVYEADGVVVGDNVKARAGSSTDSDSLGSLNYGDKVVVTGIVGDFYRIKFNDQDAYVHSSFIYGDMIYSVQKIAAVNNPSAAKGTYGIIVTDSGLNFREEPSKDGKVLRMFSKNDIVDVIESGDEWTKVSIEVLDESDNSVETVVGFVSSEFVVVQSGAKPEATKYTKAVKNVSSSKADEMISYAEKFIGTPYVWGGTNLSKGVDCSGFVYSVMKAYGVNLNRSSRDQAKNGYYIPKAELQKGDLVLFDTSGSNNGGISHVGIYIENGVFIHSSSGKQWGITKSSLNEAYYQRTYVTARRVL